VSTPQTPIANKAQNTGQCLPNMNVGNDDTPQCSPDSRIEKQEDLQRKLKELQAELDALQERDEENHHSSPSAIPANIVTNEPSLTNSESSALSNRQDEYIMQIPEVKRRLDEELFQFVNAVTFKRNKFSMSREMEEKHCRLAVSTKMVKLPPGVTTVKFGQMYAKVLRSRMNALRSNAQTNAKLKFEGELPATACLQLTCMTNCCFSLYCVVLQMTGGMGRCLTTFL